MMLSFRALLGVRIHSEAIGAGIGRQITRKILIAENIEERRVCLDMRFLGSLEARRMGLRLRC
jgi:hypothetical protein